MVTYGEQPDVQEHMACSGTYGVRPNAREDHHAMRNSMIDGQRIEGAPAYVRSRSTGSTQDTRRGIPAQDEGSKTPRLLSSFIYIDYVHHVLHVLHVLHACHGIHHVISRTGTRLFLSVRLPHVTRVTDILVISFYLSFPSTSHAISPSAKQEIVPSGTPGSTQEVSPEDIPQLFQHLIGRFPDRICIQYHLADNLFRVRDSQRVRGDQDVLLILENWRLCAVEGPADVFGTLYNVSNSILSDVAIIEKEISLTIFLWRRGNINSRGHMSTFLINLRFHHDLLYPWSLYLQPTLGPLPIPWALCLSRKFYSQTAFFPIKDPVVSHRG